MNRKKVNIFAAVGIASFAAIASQSVASKSLKPVVATNKVETTKAATDNKVLVMAPGQYSGFKQADEQQLLAFVQQQHQSLGLNSAAWLKLGTVKHSLLGTHYHFKQEVNGIPVWNGGLTISVNKNTGDISKVYRFTHSLSDQAVANAEASVATKSLTPMQALERSWTFFQPTGKLLAKPTTELVYVKTRGSLILSYVNSFDLTAPGGSWQQIIDASSGKVLETNRLDVPKKPTKIYQLARDNKLEPFERKNNSITLEQALGELKQQTLKQQSDNQPSAYANLVDATGLVFDPDPRTTLNDENLSHRAADSTFDQAYFTQTLRDVTLDQGVYSLVGPYVQIIDFEAPETRPSTTNDGNWTSKRGEAPFYDVMSYFHIDQSQRYIQSLGFTGETAIQNTSIEVDSDGQNGIDNSAYFPGNNRLSFGHGGVPDNEDADVILHEYGHAIQFDINPNWQYGDTGAIGEGFGDYWAGSYSYSTPNGQSLRPEWVYTWDGHNEFWDGRVLDQVDYQYDPSETYGPHELVNGELSDELWSTPLFQSLVELINMGQTREEVDTIVLESHFGLGAGVRMPEMAQSTLQAAVALFPDGPHASVFFKWFTQMNIVSEQPMERKDLVFEQAGANGAADPGETVAFKVPLLNDNPVSATNVAASLSSSTNGAIVVQGDVSYPDIEAYATRSNTENFELTVPATLTCGSTFNVSMDVEYQLQTTTPSDKSEQLNFEVFTGRRELVSTGSEASFAIPDNDADGVSSVITVEGAGMQVDDNFSVDVNINHGYVGDLTVTLISPEGTRVNLTVLDGDNGSEDLIGNFPADFTPAESLSAFDGEDLNGDWILTVVDGAAEDEGMLNSWQLNLSSEPECDAVSESDDSSQNALYGLALAVLIGMEAGSLHFGYLLLLMLWFRRRQK